MEIDEDAGIFHGRTVNTLAMLTFESDTVEGLKRAFAETIEDYMEWCRERGKEPEKPYSGNLSLRIPPTFIAASPKRPWKSARASINSLKTA